MTRRRIKLDRSGPWIAVVGLVMMLWCTVSTVLFAPWWGVAIAFALLIPQVWLVATWARTRPRLTIAVPLVGLLLWIGLAWLGANLWGWRP
ncbi:hypothetical protein [Aeromicrobium sp.]|uniref:hypothetical protein n=1 Tax=Aeromicrobium sp. TaxID=1871063 RepID=UPI0030C5F438